jgi:purine-nucleoside phosphorylase
MKDELIVKPAPILSFSRKKTIYIPVDSPSLQVLKALEKTKLREIKTPIGQFFLLKNKTVLYHCIGAPLAVLSLERLIASGAKEIIILGFCGSLDSGKNISDAAIITKAISEEGTTSHYFPEKRTFIPSPETGKKLEKFLSSIGLPFHKGTIVSTDAPYRETKSWLIEKKRQKIHYVDMETSAVLALAEFHHIKAAALMLVSDILSEEKHEQGFKSTELEKRVEKYFLPVIANE